MLIANNQTKTKMKKFLLNHGRALALCGVLTCFSTPAIAQVPSDLMRNCSQWKITYPDGVEDKTLCNEANNEYYYVNSAGNAITFHVRIRRNMMRIVSPASHLGKFTMIKLT